MFAPIGYRPVAELWTEFVNAHIHAVYKMSVAAYNADDFIPSLCRGSPLDVCEYLFLNDLTALDMKLASPAGEIVRIHLQSYDRVAHLLSVRSPHDSAWSSAEYAIECEEREAND